MIASPPTIAPDDEEYWARVREQYSVSPEFINLENGFFGVQADPVRDAFARHNELVNRDNTWFLRTHYAPRLARVMRMLAEFTGASPDELLITRNLTESLNILIQGYPFNAGDEVLLAEQDYDTVIDILEMVASRKSLALTRVPLPLDPESDEQIVARYEQAITPRTRVLLVTHLLHRTGQLMPVEKIAAMARRRGIDVIIDAAHSFAQLDFKLANLGADFAGVNLHKWLGAPLGVGLLYIRRSRIADIAPLFGDVRHAAIDIGKLGNVGTVSPAPILAIEDALDFHLSIGAANKESRLRYLSRYWLERARQLKGLRIFTPRDPQRYCAIAAFSIDGISSTDIAARLMAEHGIFTVVRAVGNQDVVRVTPHLYTTTSDLDRLVAALARMTSA